MPSPIKLAQEVKANMRNQTITIGDTTIEPGTSQLVELPIGNLYTHTLMHLPVHVVHGKEAGPRLFISAAIHGDELNGVEIIRRLLKLKTIKRLKGTLIAIPFVNSFGMIQNSRYLPDRRDLNRSFPGSERGSLAARLAHIFLQKIVKQCDYGIDLHTGAIHRSNLPQIRANLDDKETCELAHAFGVPVLLNANLRDGSLREAAANHGVKILLYEAGEALRLDELSIRGGVKGIQHIMHKLGMLSSRAKERSKTEPYIARSSVWIRASHSGLLQSKKMLGDRVEKDEVLGIVTDPSDMFDQSIYNIMSEHTGIIIGKTNIPLVNEGDAVFHVARFEDSNDVAAELDTFQQNTLPELMI